MSEPTTLRPRRSVLYMPSSNERALEKATSIPCDALIFDLEDAVSPDVKDSARESACAAAKSGAYGARELTIRINAVGSQWHAADLVAASAAGPDAILVPKVDSADQVRGLASALEWAGAPEHTQLWVMLESPRAILDAAAIAAASPRLTCLVLGTNDLVKELYALHVPGRAPLLASLSLAVLAARAAGVTVLDGVYNDVKDAEGFAAECRQGRELGFDGKTLIHPGQVEAANRAFTPSDREVDEAPAIIEAFESALAQGKAVATYEGRLIENLHVDTARRVLALHEAIQALEIDRAG